jgi:hypothetical protein
MLEPVGFGLEKFDEAGRYRGMENGNVVDASGTLDKTKDANGNFQDSEGLADLLAQSTQVRDCLALHQLRFGLGRIESDLPVDACALSQIRQRFAQSGYDVRELMVALTVTDAFRYRPPLATGSAP